MIYVHSQLTKFLDVIYRMQEVQQGAMPAVPMPTTPMQQDSL